MIFLLTTAKKKFTDTVVYDYWEIICADRIWMIIDKRSSKVPYIISMAGSVLLIGFYIVSHTVGLALIGL
jgi:hypothetical protein